MFDILSPRKTARQMWLASLGAVASVQEEAPKLVDDLVERGRELESGRRRQVKDKFEAAEERFESMFEQLSSNLDERVSSSLEQIGLPTRSEVQKLTERVERLAKMIDGLDVMEEETEPPRKVYHVTPQDDGWKVQAEGTERATRVTETKAEAVEVARELAKNQEPSQVVVHRMDGTIQTHYTYGELEEESES